MDKKISRREALRLLALSATATLVACQSKGILNPTVDPADQNTQSETGVQTQSPDQTTSQSAGPSSDQAYLSVARGEDTAAITEAALRAIGGIERFVKNGYDVIIKPNMCSDSYTYEYGATTNPIVVATLVRLALGAGARRVRVMDYPFP